MLELDVIQKKNIPIFISYVDLVLRVQLSELKLFLNREILSVPPHRGERPFMRGVYVEIVKKLEVATVADIHRVDEVELSFVIVNSRSSNTSPNPIVLVELVANLLSFKEID